ncbi:MAG: CBS domain-containing protein [Solirubrobacterales bacterium]
MPVDLERLTVAQAMRPKVVTIGPNETLGEAARKMRDEGVTALPVVDEHGRRGIITERDLGRAVAAKGHPADCAVKDYLTADVVAATPDWTLERAARTMSAGSFRHLLVFEGDRVIGIVSMRDIVRAWAHETEPSASELAAEAQTGEIPALDDAAHKYLYSLRRTAKQHLVAAKCPCEWEWIEVLEGQLEDRPGLDEEMLRHLWDRREPCPVLHAEGGGAD